jgi:hypothetical protein
VVLIQGNRGTIEGSSIVQDGCCTAEVGRGYGMKINVEKTKTMRISRQIYRLRRIKKTGGECGRVQLSEQHDHK